MFFIYEFILVLIIIKIIFKLTNGLCKSNVCLVGKTALITGGNSGIGYQTALGLAARGCRVIIASRNSSDVVKEEILKHTGNPNVVVKNVDLSSLNSVRNFAKEINEEEPRLDILINNSGTGGIGNSFTSDGLHTCMAINHFGPFLLTHLLVDLMKKSGGGRIIFVSSMMAFVHSLNLETLNNPYGSKEDLLDSKIDTHVYGNGKLCNIIAANGFAQRLRPFGITANSLHPGNVNTRIFAKSFQKHRSERFIEMFYKILGLFLKSPFEGAQTTLRLAVSNKLKDVTGKYFWDCVPFMTPKVVQDQEFCNRIWAESEKLVNLSPDEKLDKDSE